MRTRSYIDQLKFVMSAGPLKLELRNAVIVAMPISVRAKVMDLNYV